MPATKAAAALNERATTRTSAPESYEGIFSRSIGAFTRSATAKAAAAPAKESTNKDALSNDKPTKHAPMKFNSPSLKDTASKETTRRLSMNRADPAQGKTSTAKLRTASGSKYTLAKEPEVKPIKREVSVNPTKAPTSSGSILKYPALSRSSIVKSSGSEPSDPSDNEAEESYNDHEDYDDNDGASYSGRESDVGSDGGSPVTSAWSRKSAVSESPPPTRSPSFVKPKPEPVVSTAPLCRICGDPCPRFITRASNRNGNAGRPYWKCCNKFVAFDDSVGDSSDNPVCDCGLPSKRTTTNAGTWQGGRGFFYSCKYGQCRFYQTLTDKNNKTVILSDDMIDQLMKLRLNQN